MIREARGVVLDPRTHREEVEEGWFVLVDVYRAIANLRKILRGFEGRPLRETLPRYRNCSHARADARVRMVLSPIRIPSSATHTF